MQQILGPYNIIKDVDRLGPGVGFQWTRRSLGPHTPGAGLNKDRKLWILNPDGTPRPGWNYVWIDTEIWADANIWKD